MSGSLIPIDNASIENKIYTIRQVQVILDRDLAELYRVDTKVLNQAVKRNIERFPDEFMFQLSQDEFINWKSQIVTSNNDKMGLRRPPYAFTEQGVSMLSAVLRSKTAIDVSIKIIKSFVNMKYFLSNNGAVFQKFAQIEQILQKHDNKFDEVFRAIEAKGLKPTEGIFFDGQIYDAYVFISDLIKTANKSLILIDNYVNDSVLTLLSKRKKDCTATIYTLSLSKQLQLDLKKHNEQYQPIEIKQFKNSHDRFLIVDGKTIYHIGASLKDLGKKWFAFSKFEKGAIDVLKRLENEQ